MSKTKCVLLAFLPLVIIAGLFILILMFNPKQQEKEFNGYILWLREAVVFSENVKLNSKYGLFQMTDPVIWVEQDDIVGSLYSKAFTLKKEKYDFDDIRIIKIKFKGLYNDGKRYGHLGKYNAQVQVTKIEEYSSNLFHK
jgi:hypothetical protein